MSTYNTHKTVFNYSAQAKTKNGATEGFVGTKQEINHWLSGWADPENLYVDITDENGQHIVYKDYGRKTIPWKKNKTHIEAAFEPSTSIVHLDTQTLYDEIDNFMQKHIFDSLLVTIGTIQSYIDISANLKLPTAFLEHIQVELQLLLDGENIK